MYSAKSNSTGSPLRFVFWWFLANLAETAIRIRSILTGSALSPSTSPVGSVESSEGVTLPSEDSIQAVVSPVATGHSPLLVGHSPLATGPLSLKPLALAGLAAYAMGIAVVLIIRAQIV
jgi:hypothetical protein